MHVDASSCNNLQAAKSGLMGFPSWSREFDSPRSLSEKPVFAGFLIAFFEKGITERIEGEESKNPQL